MFRNAITMTFASAALAASSLVHAQQAGGPTPYAANTVFAAGEACAFPVEFQATSKIKEIRLKGARIITLFAKANSTLVNLADPSKSITIRGGGSWHDVVSPNGAILSTITGHNFIAGGEFAFTLLVGQFTVVIGPDGQFFDPPVGSGRQINLCDLIA